MVLKLQKNDINSQSPVDSTTANALKDLFGRYHTYLRISLTERCNLRCEYEICTQFIIKCQLIAIKCTNEK